MDAEPPLDYLLDDTSTGSGPPPGRDELLAIMARSRGQRRRLAAVGMAATLAVGGLGGWLVGAGSGRSPAGTSLAAGSTTTTAVDPGSPLASSASAGVAGSPAAGPFLQKKFVRTTADGVTLRAYQPSTAPAIPGCLVLVPGLLVEVSTAEVAGGAAGFLAAGAQAPFKAISESVIGVAEGAPVWVMTAQTDPSVVQVRAVFSDGKTDQMAPVDGWVALGHVAPPAVANQATDPGSAGSLEALDAHGKVIGRASLPSAQNLIPPGKIGPPPAGATPAPAAGGGIANQPGSAVALAPPVTATVPQGGPPATASPALAPVPPCKAVITPLPGSTTTVTK